MILILKINICNLNKFDLIFPKYAENASLLNWVMSLKIKKNKKVKWN